MGVNFIDTAELHPDVDKVFMPCTDRFEVKQHTWQEK